MAGSSSLPPRLHPVPESPPVLPCLLRRLLQRGAFDEALTLARRHEYGPHFMRSLEWLLFTTLEMESSHKHVSVDQGAMGWGSVNGSHYRQGVSARMSVCVSVQMGTGRVENRVEWGFLMSSRV